MYLPSTGLYATVSHEKTDKDRSEFAFFIPTDFPASVGSSLYNAHGHANGPCTTHRSPARPPPSVAPTPITHAKARAHVPAAPLV